MTTFTRLSKYHILFGLMPCFLAACMTSSLIPTQESEPPREMSMATSESHQEIFLLPGPLNYIKDGQIWLLGPDGQTKQQITNESAPVESFEISPTDGMLAYISNNSLIIANRNGGDRQILRAGPQLKPDPDELARLNDNDYITSTLRTPHWSPDGRKITFIENGLQVFDFETNQLEHILSYANPLNETNLIENLLSWSPDGKYFLVSQYAYPIESLFQRRLGLLGPGAYLYDLGASTLTTHAWNPDLTTIFLANASFGDPSTLVSCDLANMQCTMIAEYEPARWYYHYAYPFVTAENKLLLFMGTTDDDSQTLETFTLISLRLDGSERSNLRSDGYLLESALWSPFGDGVLITLAQDKGEFQAGSLLWLSTNEEPAIALPVMEANNMRWGLSH